MEARVFTLPDLGEGLSEAALVSWLVAVGERIAVDQPIAEVETAKSVVEVPSPYGGVITALHGAEGESVRVGAPFVTVAEQQSTEQQSTEQATAEQTSTDTATRTPPAETAAGSGNVLVGYGTREASHTGRRRRRPIVAASPTTPGAVAMISPVVRQLAKTRGIDLTSLPATGPGGIITRHDVEAARAPEARVIARSSTEQDSRTGLGVRESSPLGLFRITVATAMSRSRSEIPEATVWVDVDASELVELRRRIRFGEHRPSYSALIGRFTISALQRYPMLAGRLSPDAGTLTLFDGINLGFAADTERGLVVPVIRNADALTLRELHTELDRLTHAARDGVATPDELRGSTFTVNNYGTLGVDGSAAIINYPEVAILGLGRMLLRPWVVDGDIVPRTIMQLSLVFDHRVCDGGIAAGFVRMIADAIEHPFDLFGEL